MREVTIKNNQTNKKLYVNQDMDFTQIPEEEITLIAIFYEEIISAMLSKNMKRRKSNKSKNLLEK
jgi:hypothetical protein